MTTVPASTGCVPSTRHPLREIPDHTAALELIAGIVDRTLDREPTERPHLKPGPNRRPGPRGANGARYLLPPVIIFQPQKFWLCEVLVSGECRIPRTPVSTNTIHTLHLTLAAEVGKLYANPQPAATRHRKGMSTRTDSSCALEPRDSNPSRRSRTASRDLPHCGMGHEGCTRTEATIYSREIGEGRTRTLPYNLYKKTALTGCRQTPIGRFLNPINFFEPGRKQPPPSMRSARLESR